MDFNLSEEQQMLADTVARWLEAEYTFAERQRSLAAPSLDETRWRSLAELGVLGLNVPSAYGGLDGTAVETLVVMQAFGRALFAEPFLSTAVVGAALVARAGSEVQKRSILPAVISGERRLALAALEPDGHFDLERIDATLHRSGDRLVLDGRKAVVLDGDSAHQLIVSARTEGAAEIRLVLVDAGAPGVRIRGFATLDGQRCAEVQFDGVELEEDALLGGSGEGLELLEWGVGRAIAALCAEAVGAMEQLIELTVEHLRSRIQFGQPIAKFQALQHRIADMQIAAEQARSLALFAAAGAESSDATARRQAIAAAKALVGRCGVFVGEQAVQLHGGMGMTDELAVGYYFKRLVCIDITWGNADHHVERYGERL